MKSVYPMLLLVVFWGKGAHATEPLPAPPLLVGNCAVYTNVRTDCLTYLQNNSTPGNNLLIDSNCGECYGEEDDFGRYDVVCDAGKIHQVDRASLAPFIYLFRNAQPGEQGLEVKTRFLRVCAVTGRCIKGSCAVFVGVGGDYVCHTDTSDFGVFEVVTLDVDKPCEGPAVDEGDPETPDDDPGVMDEPDPEVP